MPLPPRSAEARRLDAWTDDLRPGDVILHARKPHPRDGPAATLRFRNPVRVHRLPAGADPGPLLDALDGELDAGFALAGRLNYEAGYALVGVSGAPTAPYADGWFGVYPPERVERIAHADRPLPAAAPANDAGALRADDLVWAWDEDRWRSALARVQAALRAGESYQANLTTRLSFPAPDVRAIYRTLSAAQPTAFGALLDDGEVRIASASPELFLRVDRVADGLRVATRPMKGTAPRGADADEDDRLAARLRADAKSRAENVMITDLLRNDLGRVARPGRVRVPALFEVERYRSVLQLTSTVEADLPPEAGLGTLLRATFPCGSITGAPKKRTMELLRDLEDGPRGAYTGAIGYALPGDHEGGGARGLGHAVFSVAIRTVVVQDGVGTLGVGGGIVIDSDPGEEYDELRAKARFLTDPAPPLVLIETMRAEGRRVRRLDAHLARLARSASFHDVPLHPDSVRDQVVAALRDAPDDAVQRLRLALDETGAPWITVVPHVDPAPDAGPARLAWAVPTVDPTRARQRHKTSDRALYDRASAWAREAGVDEVLFRTPSGRIAEGAITNLFVRLPGERTLRTPPVRDGALPGVLRGELLARGEAVEATLTANDLEDADLFVGNALRGLRPAVLTEARFDPEAVDREADGEVDGEVDGGVSASG